MRLVISQFISLDGVVQAPGGPAEDADGGFAHGGWSMPYFDPEVMGGFIDEAMQETQALLFGRRTWQTMAAAWPDRDHGSDPFATTMNDIAKYVVSSTLTQDDLHKTVFPTDGEKRPLEPVHTTTVASGVLCCVCRSGQTHPTPHREG